jgi:hypothetical protein
VGQRYYRQRTQNKRLQSKKSRMIWLILGTNSVG